MSLPDLDAKLSTDMAQFLTKDVGSIGCVQTLRDSNLYWALDKRLDTALLKCEHTFRVQGIEIYNAYSSQTYSGYVKSRLSSSWNPHFLFHGTKESNHTSIFENGFEYYGIKDQGFIGKGVYLSSYPEYAAAYIEGKMRIECRRDRTKIEYRTPVKVGVTCKLLGCIVIVGTTERALEEDEGGEISSSLDSRWAWVDYCGRILAGDTNHFATEYAIRQSVSVYPHFRISLTRVACHVVWFDPNIGCTENSRYKQQLKSEKGLYLFSTSDSAMALRALKRKKEGTEYRAITSGSGGEDFVRQLRGAGIQCKVLVFCCAVDYHKMWARRFPNVEVTAAAYTMMNFATWK